MMLLQIATSIISDPGLIITTLLDRMNLLQWAQNPKDLKPNDENNEIYSIADEFLHILIGILCERFSIDVSDVTLQDEIRHNLSLTKIVNKKQIRLLIIFKQNVNDIHAFCKNKYLNCMQNKY